MTSGCVFWIAVRALLTFAMLLPETVAAMPPPQHWIRTFDGPQCHGPHAVATVRTVRGGQFAEVRIDVQCRGDRMTLRPMGGIAGRRNMLVRQNGDLWRIGPRGRLIRLTGARLSESWLGTYFTPADLLGGHHWSRDYDAATAFTGMHHGVFLTEVVLKARASTAAFGKVVAEVRIQDGAVQQLRYYDRQGALVRREMFGDIRSASGRPEAMLLRMVDAGDTATSYSEWVYAQ